MAFFMPLHTAIVGSLQAEIMPFTNQLDITDCSMKQAIFSFHYHKALC